MNVLSSIESRKLQGLVLLFAFLIVLLAIYIVADVLWNVSETLFTTIAGTGGTGAAAHQAAQGAADYQQAKLGAYRGSDTVSPGSAPPAVHVPPAVQLPDAARVP